MRFTTDEIAAAVGGSTTSHGVTVDGVATDSRRVRGGELFVPLRAARDGHDFIETAVAAGAAAYLTERTPPVGGAAAIRVGDAAAALRDLAAHGRGRIHAVTIAITGSVGKTTTKDLVTAVLGADRSTHASERSFNNDIGVPLTILNAPEGTEALVLEIGANAPGEIERLCRIARPTIGVVTRVDAAHTLGFGDIDGVARAKAELVVALPASGVAVLNADDPRVARMSALTDASVMTFGREQPADVRVTVARLDDELRAVIHAETPWGALDARLAARGEHQAMNAAAAIAVAGRLGVDLDRIAEELGRATTSAMRMDLRAGRRGLRVLDDSYNANPASVAAALHALVAVPGRRHVAVLGHMAELGPSSADEHHRMAVLAKQLGVEVIALDAPDYGVESVADIAAAIARLDELDDGDVVLVKGSRVAGLERLAAALESSD